MQKFFKLLSLPLGKKILLGQAIFLLPLCQLCVKYLHFNKLIKLFRLTPVEPASKSPSTPNDNAILIQWVISRSLTIPYPLRPRCLAQALVARVLLHRRGEATILSVGVMMNNEDLRAHAWLECGDIIVTGEEELGSYKKISSFG